MRDEVSKRCPLCKEAPTNVGVDPDPPTLHVDCPRCGRFIFSSAIYHDLATIADPHALSGYCRELTELGREPARLTRENLVDLASLGPRVVVEKADRLLRAIARKSQHPGQEVALIPQQDYPLAYCHNAKELWLYLNHLSERRLIKSPGAAARGDAWVVLPDGWTVVESRKPSNLESEKAFVAMWFDDALVPAYASGIKPAIEDDAGYRAIRVDAEQFLGDVVERIIAEIRESRFIVADVTGQRNGVYFEGGFAMGLRLPVIWTCRDSDVSKLHFDTRQLNHIVWKEPLDLRNKLALRIRATIGLGPRVGQRPPI